MSFWNKIRSVMTAIGVSSEIGLYAADVHSGWKIFVLIATLIGIFVTHFIEDTNNDGIADIFEKDPNQPKE